MDIPTGLINGKSPLLNEFLERRTTLRLKRDELRFRFSNIICPPSVVSEYNALNDVLCGRRP